MSTTETLNDRQIVARYLRETKPSLNVTVALPRSRDLANNWLHDETTTAWGPVDRLAKIDSVIDEVEADLNPGEHVCRIGLRWDGDSFDVWELTPPEGGFSIPEIAAELVDYARDYYHS